MAADCHSQQDHRKQAGVYCTVLMGSVRGDTQAQTIQTESQREAEGQSAEKHCCALSLEFQPRVILSQMESVLPFGQ